MPAKGKAGQEAKPKPEKKDGSDTSNETMTAPPHLTGRWDFSRLFKVAADPDLVDDPEFSMARVQKVAHDAVSLAADSQAISDGQAIADAGHEGFVPKPMTHEEVRLWLQSFNAGPYALLKYKGDVPYKETQNYVPRVLKAYEEDYKTEYEPHIQKYAAKYGLDPQLIKAIMKTESDFNNDTVSHAGARGLMQVMPVVWQDVKKKYGFDWDYSSGVFEPEKNIEVACAYLAWLRYDFLPRHFDAYEKDPEAPTILVRDKDRGVPDRESPRIVASVATSDTNFVNEEIVLTAATQAVEEPKVVADAGTASEKKRTSASESAKAETSEKASAKKEKPAEKAKSDEQAKAKPEKAAAAKPKVEISDAGDVKKSSSNGKARVVLRGGSGSSVKISVANGKVEAKSAKAETRRADTGKKKTAEVAKAKTKAAKEEAQGG